MAQTQRTQQSNQNQAGAGPVLRPGRPADPAPAKPPAMPSAPERPAEAAPEASGAGNSADQVALDGPETAVEPQQPQEPPSVRVQASMRQHRKRQLLRQCERVLLLDFEALALSDWPDSYSLAQARRRRDLWLFSATVSALVFFSGMTGLVPAWLAGGGFGATVLITLAGVPAVRRLYATRPSHLDLVMKRRRLLREARKHIAHLEGETGLVWQCAGMAEFNPVLRSPRFAGLVNLSQRRVLARALTRRDHIRLCLIFLLEAEKAYGRLESAYLDGHQEAIDQGWDEAAEVPDSASGQPGDSSP